MDIWQGFSMAEVALTIILSSSVVYLMIPKAIIRETRAMAETSLSRTCDQYIQLTNEIANSSLFLVNQMISGNAAPSTTFLAIKKLNTLEFHIEFARTILKEAASLDDIRYNKIVAHVKYLAGNTAYDYLTYGLDTAQFSGPYHEGQLCVLKHDPKKGSLTFRDPSRPINTLYEIQRLVGYPRYSRWQLFLDFSARNITNK